jgi:hypothetical protein
MAQQKNKKVTLINNISLIFGVMILSEMQIENIKTYVK